jgi:hypothetical protein
MDDAVATLMERLALLEYKFELLSSLVDSERNPFAYLCLESSVTREQQKKIFALMDEARASLRTEHPMEHHEFERRVYEICPGYMGDYHFAEAIVSTLNDTHRWNDVYDYMKQNGMNLS